MSVLAPGTVRPQPAEPLTIAVLGLGYVGTTSMACLANLGHRVIGVDIAEQKVAMLDRGQSPIREPQVAELLRAGKARNLLSATGDAEAAIDAADLCLVCVGTPSLRNGSIDARHLVNVLTAIAEVRARTKRCIPIFVRSTALPSVHDELIRMLRAKAPGQQPAYCVHPEFLREGQSVADFYNPPKIIYGCSDAVARTISERLYPGIEAPIVYTDPATAALVKYADNCFHALKVTFANEIGMLASSFGVDARRVMESFCLDTKLNISTHYLRPGMPFGGSCLPKDLRGVVSHARQHAVSLPMLEHVIQSNDVQIQRIVELILHAGGRRVGLIGLTFKDDTDDVRESPMVTIAEHLLGKGCRLRIYDDNLVPQNLVGANKKFVADTLPHLVEMMVDDCASLVAESDVVVVARACKLALSDLPWQRHQLVFDMAGLPTDARPPVTVHGLYWPTLAPITTLRTVA